VVTNLAGRTLKASVVVDGDTLKCGCVLPPGQTVHLGYYRAAGGTAVLVSDSTGWSGRLGALEARRDSLTGRVVVQVDSATLRPPSRPARSPRAAGAGRSRAAPGSPPALLSGGPPSP
jgi:hypothetical protein